MLVVNLSFSYLFISLFACLVLSNRLVKFMDRTMFMIAAQNRQTHRTDIGDIVLNRLSMT